MAAIVGGIVYVAPFVVVAQRELLGARALARQKEGFPLNMENVQFRRSKARAPNNSR